MSSTACWPWPSPTCCAARPTTPACTCRSASCWPSWPASRKPCCSTTTAAKAAPGLGACSPTWTPPNSAWPTCSTFTATHRPADHAHTGELGNTPTPPAHTVLPAETPSTINEGRKLTLAAGGLLIVFSMWWLYFEQHAEERLSTTNLTSFVWGYGHYLIFASAAGVGAGGRAPSHRAARRSLVALRDVRWVPSAAEPVRGSLEERRIRIVTSIGERIAGELGVRPGQVMAAIELLDGGATVPFIARYRKEMTGTLDDAQLRTLEDRLGYLRELEERRAAVIESIRAQGKLDPELEAQILAADSKARLEDLYLPFRPKRRTKAQVAREAGLEPLADRLLADPAGDPRELAAAFVDAGKGVADVPAALEGARAVLVERFAEDADLIGGLRERMWTRGRLVSRVRDGKQEAGAKFADYFDFAEPFSKLPSHRILAMFRGESEEVLDLTFDPDPAPRAEAGVLAPGAEAGAAATSTPSALGGYELEVAGRFGVAHRGRPGDRWLLETVRWAWRTRILVHLALDLRARLWQAAEEEAVRVFAANLRDLLLAAPAGTRATMGLDPGFRTGVKVAVVAATGKVVATQTIHPHQPQRRWDEALGTLARLARTHQVELIAIGNGTASRETDRLAADLISRNPELPLTKVVVSEAGASVYSASPYASRELPQLDVSLRGAVSIARRLQDPLAELVKIDPRSIGVGQYQHDLSQSKLSRSLDAVVEDCVNAVGVDLNTASVPLLGRVSGIGGTLAENIVAHRDANGPFRSRRALAKVPRLGPKAFRQCAASWMRPPATSPR